MLILCGRIVGQRSKKNRDGMDIGGRWLDFYALMSLLGFLVCKAKLLGLKGFHSKVEQERGKEKCISASGEAL